MSRALDGSLVEYLFHRSSLRRHKEKQPPTPFETEKVLGSDTRKTLHFMMGILSEIRHCGCPRANLY
jgi:hypothetical protein